MLLDMHIHIKSTATRKETLVEKLREAQVDGGVLLSAMPRSMDEGAACWQERLQHVTKLCRDSELLFPFFFIDPTEPDALIQVQAAVEAGVSGFKIICTHFYPGDPACLAVCRAAASAGKPVLFHSGILWNGAAASGIYNRPVGFEPLLEVPGLRFALAHISWPWCDECIAVYGKWEQASREAGWQGAQMFIDSTPGTPRNYRAKALESLIGTGYDVLHNLMFGTDNLAESYDVKWAREWAARDRAVYTGLGLSDQEQEDILANNLLRFLRG